MKTIRRFTYNFLLEPSDQVYFDLLDYASTECKYALVVVRESIRLSSKGQEVFRKFSKFLYTEKQTDEWPGTRLLNQQARIFVYSYVPEFIEILKAETSSLYQWLQPDLPEDLCLLRVDETPWLVTISHENDGYLVLSEPEKNHFFSALLQYRIMVKKEI